MTFREKLGKELLIFDGAMGTMLQARGLEAGELPETWNVLKPQEIKDVHLQYLNAGADIIKTNTFGANCFKCKGTDYTVEPLVGEGLKVAREAIAESGKTAYAALDMGSLGKLLKPLGELEFEQACEAFGEIVRAGRDNADLVLIETMSDCYETKAAVLAAKENSQLPVIVTMTFDADGKLLTGGDIASAVATLEGLGVDAIGFNCGLGPKQMLQLLPQLTACCSVPVVINSNAGLPVVENGKTVFTVGADEFATDVKKLIEGGAALVGGCCGTTPDHIRAVKSLCGSMAVKPVERKSLTVVSSYNHAVYFGEKPLIIGERINPTGKSRFKQALRDNDLDYILKEGISQQENGAHILDVNVGLPEINEAEMLEKTVTGLQAVLDLPLQLDTTDIAAMERAMRVYNGKPMINSVNGKEESMKAVFPLVKKYGGVVVCLTLDESGIPETAEGRVKIAEKIIRTAESYGIDKKDLLIDALVMTVSTGDQNGLVTLEALNRARYQLGVHTVLGVSNISFGLPQRENITSTFFTLAMSKGLSAGIVNPNSAALMSAYYSYCALSGNDKQCLAYIEKFSGTIEQKAQPQTGEMSLFDSIVKGMSESAAKATAKLLQEKDSLSIINEDLIPALDKVGKGFEAKTVFLPQLLMSADAAKAGFDQIKAYLEASGEKKESKSKVILATVKGDIHDIGKNIVKVLLENYGFDVLDLGKDVAPEIIVETAVKENVKLVGLSALMTTTVVNMEETIKQLRAAGNFKIMVGGAVLTQEYADMIGADFYSPDAMGSVRYANELFDKGEI